MLINPYKPCIHYALFLQEKLRRNYKAKEVCHCTTKQEEALLPSSQSPGSSGTTGRSCRPRFWPCLFMCNVNHHTYLANKADSDDWKVYTAQKLCWWRQRKIRSMTETELKQEQSMESPGLPSLTCLSSCLWVWRCYKTCLLVNTTEYFTLPSGFLTTAGFISYSRGTWFISSSLSSSNIWCLTS